MTDINHVIAINTVALIKHYLQFLEEEMTVAMLHIIVGLTSSAVAFLLIVLLRDFLKDIRKLIQKNMLKTTSKQQKKEDEERIAKINAWLGDLAVYENKLKENLPAEVRDAFNKRIGELNANIIAERALLHKQPTTAK